LRLRLTRPATPADRQACQEALSRASPPASRRGKGSSPAGPWTARPAAPPSDPVQAGQTW